MIGHIDREISFLGLDDLECESGAPSRGGGAMHLMHKPLYPVVFLGVTQNSSGLMEN